MKISILRASVVLLALIIAGCTEAVKKDEAENASSNAKLGKMAGNCDPYCTSISDAPACSTECLEKFMSDYGTSEIKWTSCSDDFGIPTQGCNGSVSFTSKVKFCWGTSPSPGRCFVYMEIDQLPSGKDANGNPTTCFPCLSGAKFGAVCIKMTASCVVDNGVGTITLTEEDPDLNGDSEIGNFTVTITGDPKITLCCTERIGGGGFVNRCCTGDLY